jgi:hypothetical protein
MKKTITITVPLTAYIELEVETTPEGVTSGVFDAKAEDIGRDMASRMKARLDEMSSPSGTSLTSETYTSGRPVVRVTEGDFEFAL